MPDRTVEHVNEFAVGIPFMVYTPSRSKIEYAVPDKMTGAPTEK
jgi:hypothetical protein